MIKRVIRIIIFLKFQALCQHFRNLSSPSLWYYLTEFFFYKGRASSVEAYFVMRTLLKHFVTYWQRINDKVFILLGNSDWALIDKKGKNNFFLSTDNAPSAELSFLHGLFHFAVTTTIHNRSPCHSHPLYLMEEVRGLRCQVNSSKPPRIKIILNLTRSHVNHVAAPSLFLIQVPNTAWLARSGILIK